MDLLNMLATGKLKSSPTHSRPQIIGVRFSPIFKVAKESLVARILDAKSDRVAMTKSKVANGNIIIYVSIQEMVSFSLKEITISVFRVQK